MKVNIFHLRQPIIIILSTFFLSVLLSISVGWLNKEATAKSNSPMVFVETDVERATSDGVNSDLEQQAKSSLVASTAYKTTKAFEQYQPKYAVAEIDPSNYGDRYSTDIHGNVLNNQPIAVLHETVGSASSAINTFRTKHHSDLNQASYHALITLDGMIIYLVPSDKRAFGAGNSVFESSWGVETVQTNPNLPASVNNFAYHISLETPTDGRTKSGTSYHSGYTDSQYKSLAWLLALSSIPDDRITTHRNVDLSGHRFDPRSFDFTKFFQVLHAYRQPTTGKVSIQ